MKKGILYFLAIGLVCLGACNDEVILEDTDINKDVDLNSPKENHDVLVGAMEVKSFNAVNLPINYLGQFTHEIYGTTQASITAQVLLSNEDPSFGLFSQGEEDRGVKDNDSTAKTIPEEETVTAVYLYIPFYKNSLGDADNDGVIDELDDEPNNGSNDSDNDGIPNNIEKSQGTDPLSDDTDNDGEKDGDDEDTVTNNFPRFHELDSIYGDQESSLEISVHKMNYYLRDFDPSAEENMGQLQEYGSDFDFGPFQDVKLGEYTITISNQDIVKFKEDDPETEDKDESKTLDWRLEPGIRIPLDVSFFQENLLDKEGAGELFNNNTFKDFFRGITVSANVVGQPLMPALNFSGANISIEYTYKKNDTKNTTDTSDDEIVEEKSSFLLNFNGKRVNSLQKTPVVLPANDNMYLNGGLGHLATVELDLSTETPIYEKIKNKAVLLNEANLIFHIDTDQMSMVKSGEPFRLYLYELEDNKPAYVPSQDVKDDNNRFKSFPVYDGRIQKDDNGKGTKYRVRLTSLINETLIDTDETKLKFGLAITSNINVVNYVNAKLSDDTTARIPLMSVINPLGTVLYGTEVPSGKENKKLQLELIYTEVK
ncbi:MAG: DUF4270 domain-containing protein [Flavobacteriaceae bacterium]|nr:DUF4270 domain-containing protein [Flavobacteriaceae bacterium]